MFLDIYKKVIGIFDKGYNQVKCHTIKDKNYFEKKLIGEGGFGYVYLVEDSNCQNFAIKIINITSEKQLNLVKKELRIWDEISNKCEYAIKLIDYEIIKVNDNKEEMTTSCISIAKCLMEYSSEGTLLDYINKTIINEEEVIDIIGKICEFLNIFHDLGFTHRDIKPENILKFEDKLKICDFGSCTDEVFIYEKLGKKEMNKKKDEFEKISTFNYRSPEMLDKFCEFDCDNKVDIWMLGCLTYLCSFRKHPFENCQKLGIINCAYSFDEESINSNKVKFSERFKDLIRVMLNPNPKKRPSAKILLKVVKNWGNNVSIKLPNECKIIKSKQDTDNKDNSNEFINTIETLVNIRYPISIDQEVVVDDFDFS